MPQVAIARDAIKRMTDDMAASTLRKCPVAHTKSTPGQDGAVPLPTPRKCPVAHRVTPPSTYEEMEKDFTTQGKPSSLECPFAKMTKAHSPGVAESIDPIAAEFHADALSAQSLDAARACGKCPIRFLDKHSPEEVAQYFENHKHELPRSHEVCVKRYQQNETSIRQLDAKYGNIVSMIQGLGNKHKQYLPSEEQAALDGSDQKSTAAVENWAKNVDGDTNMIDGADGEVEDEPRMSHFDKPLRDVRVGESPARPWGIHVPADRPQAPSAALSTKLDAASPEIKPVAGGVSPSVASTRISASHATSTRDRGRRPNQIIFNGPVFLGYSPEQAAQFLNQIGARHGG